MRERACGLDDRPVEPNREEQSISAEQTFAADIQGSAPLALRLLRLADRATSRLRAQKLAAGTVSIKIRRADFTTYTRQRALRPPTQDSSVVSAAAKTLLEQWLATQPDAAVRLLGVGVSDLQTSVQADLFGASLAAGSRLDMAIDGIRDRFGSGILTRASLLPGTPGRSGSGG
jgi:DNA polymerase-4